MSIPRRCLLVAATVAVAACGCRSQAETPHGSPVLLEVLWDVDGLSQRVWSRDADASVATTGAAYPSTIDFVFDRRLDGARIEDTVDDKPVPKANPPITVAWPDMATAMSDPPFAADVFYNSLAIFGPNTTYAFVRPHIAGLPSGTPITFALDPNGLTSVYGEPMDGPTSITVTTAALTVTLPTSSATVPTTFLAAMAFSTRAPAAAALAPFIHVHAASDGAALPFVLAPDAGNSKRIYIGPAGCLGGWPPDARVEITADAGLPDAFGRPLAAAASGSFMTAHIAATPVDGGCGPGDAGPGDAGSGETGGGDGG
jgi:hypothetical protein